MEQARTTVAKAKFLDAYSQSGNVTDAAGSAGVTTKQVYVWRSVDPEFKESMDVAVETYAQRVQDLLFDFPWDDKIGPWIRLQSIKFILEHQLPDRYGKKETVRTISDKNLVDKIIGWLGEILTEEQLEQFRRKLHSESVTD